MHFLQRVRIPEQAHKYPAQLGVNNNALLPARCA
jgi:hypothetical protein